MTRIRILIAGGAVAAAALSACASGAGATTAATADQAAVATVFRDHNQAMLAHDFAKVCSLNDPAFNQQLVARVSATAGGQVSSCPDALKKLYTSPRAVAVSDGIAKSAQIKDVHINGDTATITWSVQASGKQSTTTSDMRRIGGQWQLTGPTAAK